MNENSKALDNIKNKTIDNTLDKTINKIIDKTKDKTRAEIRAEYKKLKPQRGIWAIRNLINGKIFLESSSNLHGPFNKAKMELRFNSFKSEELNRDWNELGEEAFSFEILDVLPEDPDEFYDFKSELKVLENLWLEKLEPWGDKGYNKPPKKN